jgi:transcriptional accessory protein Tex/SPT6
MADLYEADFYAWANEQARLIREGRLADADLENIAEEIESMGRSEKRELVSRFGILLLHLLKWQFQPRFRGASWKVSMQNARDDLAEHLSDNPSLRGKVEEAMENAYRRARRLAGAETGLEEQTFPLVCPWSAEQVLDQDFWPDS